MCENARNKEMYKLKVDAARYAATHDADGDALVAAHVEGGNHAKEVQLLQNRLECAVKGPPTLSTIERFGT